MGRDLPSLVSTSVCADQFTMMIAHSDQIKGLSVYARDSNISPLSHEATQFDVIGNSIEEILASGAEVVVLDTFGHQRKAAFLERMGLKTLRLPMVDSFDGISLAVQDFADAIGRSKRGREINKQLGLTKSGAIKSGAIKSTKANRPSAVYFLPSGSTPGKDTFVHDLLTLTGFDNYSALKGVHGWQHIGLESLLQSPPDIFILSFSDRFALSARAGFARHPRYNAMLKEFPTISVKSADWICAGPFVTRAIASLLEGRARVERESRD